MPLSDMPTGVVSADTAGDRAVLITRGHHALLWKASAGVVTVTEDVPGVVAEQSAATARASPSR